MDPGGIPFPPELQPVRNSVQNYVNARLQQFAYALAYQINPNLTREQVDFLAGQAVRSMLPPPPVPQQSPPPPQQQQPPQQMQHQMQPALVPKPESRGLRLVLRHDCQSSGCGDHSCKLCQYNPSRICKRNLKQKYLIDDHLRAKCGAQLRCEVVDEGGGCVEEPLPGLQLEIHVLNGDKYKEVCPDNTLLSPAALRACIIEPPLGQGGYKPLLRKEGVEDGGPRILLAPEAGKVPLSDLQCTTSSEALLSGKAPTFRLLVWAVDGLGQHNPGVTYVVSENFVVATKRVKHAIKSDIPSITDHVGKIVHIGKATVDKLLDLRAAAAEEKLEVDFPDHLNRIEKVGQFRELVAMSEGNNDMKHKLRHLLKLSTDKWDEVVQHVLSAVVPDYRPRLWWHEPVSGGLLFSCKNGAILMDAPMAYVSRPPGGPPGPLSITPLQQLEPTLFNMVPKLKQGALEDWYASGHPGWSIFWSDPSDPLAQMMQPHAGNLAGLMGVLQAVDPVAAAAAAEVDHIVAMGGHGAASYHMSGGGGGYSGSRRSSAAHDASAGGGYMGGGPSTRQRQSSGGGGMSVGTPVGPPPGPSPGAGSGYPPGPLGGVPQQPPLGMFYPPPGAHNGASGMMPMGPAFGAGGRGGPAGPGPGSNLLQQQQQMPRHSPQHMGPPQQQQGGPMGVPQPPPYHLGGSQQQQGGLFTPPGQQGLPGGALPPSGGPGSSKGRGPTPFATMGLQSAVSDAFPAMRGGNWTPTAGGGRVTGASDPGCLPVTHGAAGGAGAAAAGAPTSMSDTHALPGVPSLEMLNTEDLPEAPPGPFGGGTKDVWALPSIDSQGQALLLQEFQPSIGVEQLLQGLAGGPGGGPGREGGAGGDGIEPGLSLKFSMSLDLAELKSGEGGSSGN